MKSSAVQGLAHRIRSAGVDRAVFFSLVNRAAAITFSIVTLVLVLTYFAPDRQGYYYTFASLLLLQTFLDLGMGNVLAQFVSHEWAGLHLDESAHIVGDAVALSRLGGLVRVGLRWYLYAAGVFFLAVGLAGTFLLTRHQVPDGVLVPWWLVCAATAVSLLQWPLRSLLEGSNQVARVQRIATIILACSSMAGWLAILGGLQLYAVALTAGLTAVLALALFGVACTPFLRLAGRNAEAHGFSWREEFWPQQWRIAVSWMSGFCVFQSFVPILFYFQGAVIAGQMGASLQIYNAVNTVALSWINPKGPLMGMMGARGQIPELRATVRRTLRYSTVAAICGGVLVLAGFYLMETIHFKADRFAGMASLAVLMATAVIMQRSNVETLAIRFQKIEPFIVNSVVSAVLVLISNIVMSRYFGVTAVCAGFAAVMAAVTVPWIHSIYEARADSMGRSASYVRQPTSTPAGN